MEDKPAPVRGRARGRARPIQPPAAQLGQLDISVVDEPREEGVVSPPPRAEGGEALAHMFGSASGGSGNGNGSGNGSGNGHGSNGNGSERGGGGGRGSSERSRGSPRGSAGSPHGNGGNGNGNGGNGNGNGNGNGEFGMPDFIRSRPSEFEKKGTSGRPVGAIANYYQFRKHPEFEMNLYTVKVEPLVEEDKKVRKLVRAKAEQIGSYILTGRQLFTTKAIKADFLVNQVELTDDPGTTYTVVFEHKRVVREGEGVQIQFYNCIVRHMQKTLEYQLLGRHYFDPKAAVPFPSWRLELWPGFNNSIRQQEVALMLNVDSCWKVLQTEDVFQKMFNIRRDAGANWQAAVTSAIVGMMIVTKYNSRAYKVDRIDFGANPNSTFETKDGPISYVEYYKNRYQIPIKNMQQPMLVSEPRLRDIRRGQTGDIYLVPELCFPCGLNDEIRSNFRLMKDLAGCLHMPPTGRVQTMRQFLNRVTSNEEIQRSLRAWGIQFMPNPVEIQARILPPEEIVCGNNQLVRPDDKADWSNPFRNQKMLVSARLAKWVIVVTNRDSQGVGGLFGTMQKVATPLGYQLMQPRNVVINDTRADSYVGGVTQAMSMANGALDMIFIVLASNNADTYAAIKRKCSIDYGIPSQCFLAKNLSNQRGLMSICTKMVIQMNAKQGGEPWGVKSPLKNIMILGYDVHHAGPGGGMSVGAMCATVNASLGKYFSTVAKLPAREEVATAVAAMFEKCLKAYAAKNNALPERIMMYRDGVGEGQLEDVYKLELQGFKDRIKNVYAEKGAPRPKLSYIVVNKRISTRFFEGAGGVNWNNPKPGFVVDDIVTRPERYDFFLVSQTARQGCVSPTYYNVLLDESGLDADKIQRFTFKLCHLYYNWSGTVAVPGPCQNAHKLAFLVGTALKRPAHANLAYLLHFL